jgi:hypothetical protein
METKLIQSNPNRRPETGLESTKALPSYSDMKGSSWMISYRFSDQPEPRHDEEGSPRRTYYAGKLALYFRPDGYTEILSHEPISTKKSTISISKCWGWDVERSNQDEKEYVLFSINVGNLPESNGVVRFYLQARQERIGNVICLKEGTVTVKQDYLDAQKMPSMWGVFNPRGILAQFQACGNFVATPMQNLKVTR